MATHPILFNPLMIRALLREIEAPGTGKTQTRRVMNPQPPQGYTFTGITSGVIACFEPPELAELEFRKRLFRRGDLLWVREAFNVFSFSQDGDTAIPWKTIPTHADLRTANEDGVRCSASVHYRASPINSTWGDEMRWRPGIHMPMWASRITCRVTDVRVQRLQEISEADAIAEGAYVAKASGRVADDYGSMAVAGQWFSTARAWYADLWDRINGPGAWARNDWVIATTFQPLLKNVHEVTP